LTTGRGIAARSALLLLLAAATLSHALPVLAPESHRAWDGRLADLLFRLRARTGWGGPPPPSPLLYAASVDVEERAADRAAERARTGEVVRLLGTLGAALQAHDAVFPAGFEATTLVEAVRATPRVVLGCVAGLDAGARAAPGSGAPWRLRVEGDARRIPAASRPTGNDPALRAASAGEGFLDLLPDPDGVVRRAPLLARAGDGYLPSLALLAACVHLDVTPDRVRVRLGDAIVLEGARRPGAPAADVSIPVDERGFAIVDWRSAWEGTPHLPVARIALAARDPREADLLRARVSGRTVFLGDLSLEGGDVVPTPLEAIRPGLGAHGAIFESLLGDRPLRAATSLEMLLLEAGLALGLLLAARLGGTWTFVAALLLALLAAAAAQVVLFAWGGVVPRPALPLGMLLFAAAGLLTARILASERRRAALRSSFEAYFPPPLVRELVDSPDRVLRGGGRKEITILFSDLVGFSARSERTEPPRLQRMLNRYFGEMVEAVFAEEGTLDKFIGDGLMVFFGDPLPQPDHARRAVRCAIEMQRRIRRLDADAEVGEPLHARIGIATGVVVVGNLGSPRRLSYTAIGSVVNLASRLEGAAPKDGILVSEGTWNALGGAFDGRRVGPLALKNIDPVHAWEILPKG